MVDEDGYVSTKLPNADDFIHGWESAPVRASRIDLTEMIAQSLVVE